MPGAGASVVIDLEPGNYLLLCGIPDATGLPHAMRGMVRRLRVGAAGSAAGAWPTADAILRMTDFSFSLSHPLKPGAHTLRLINDGAQAHELVLIRLDEGASTQDFIQRYRPGGLPNSAGREMGGLTGIDPGREAFLLLDLEAGRYGLLCFLADPVTRTPHFATGMWMDLDVTIPSFSRE